MTAKTVAAVGLAAVLTGAPAGAGYAAYRHDAALRGVLPAGTVVGGVDVSNLDRDAAVAAVRAAVEREFDRPAVVTVAGRSYSTTARKLGATHDVDKAVDTAFDRAESGNWLTRGWDRVFAGGSAPKVTVTVTDYDPARLEAIADRAAKELNRAPVDGGMTEEGGWLRVTKPRFGQAVDTKAFVRSLAESLEDGQKREVPLVEVHPRNEVPDTAILVRTGENKLYLYKDGEIARTFGVATGSPRFPTPTGRYQVTLKRYLPTWVNPWSKWSMNMPAKIGPGPNNPLGTRALNIDAPGIRIHGTPHPRSIGYSVSHGCIRMRMPDVEALYPLVPKGTPVFIVKAAPARVPGFNVDTGPAGDGG